MKNDISIIFILGSISQPRCIKRIKSFISAGYDVYVYGFDRGVYQENYKQGEFSVIILDDLVDGKKYFSKTLKTIKGLKYVLGRHYFDNNYFYSFGLLNTLILFFCGCRRYVYEISDILYGYKRFKYFQWWLKKADVFLIKRSLLTVFTSQGFIDYFGVNNYSNIMLQSNKLDYSFIYLSRIYTPLNSDKFIFSFIGAFRYPNTIFRFAEIIGRCFPMHEFSFYGDSIYTQDVIRLASYYPNVKYYGSYKNPEDLPMIYQNVDIIVACYDTTGLNERIAEPNKLYEAMFFSKPIVVSKSTFLEKQVEKYKAGYSINAHFDDSIIDFVKSLSQDKINVIKENLISIDLSELIDDNSKNIISFLKKNAYF